MRFENRWNRSKQKKKTPAESGSVHHKPLANTPKCQCNSTVCVKNEASKLPTFIKIYAFNAFYVVYIFISGHIFSFLCLRNYWFVFSMKPVKITSIQNGVSCENIRQALLILWCEKREKKKHTQSVLISEDISIFNAISRLRMPTKFRMLMEPIKVAKVNRKSKWNK